MGTWQQFTLKKFLGSLKDSPGKTAALALLSVAISILIVSMLVPRYAAQYRVTSATNSIEATRSMAFSGISLGLNPLLSGSDATGDFAQYLAILNSFKMGTAILEDQTLVDGMFPPEKRGRFSSAPAAIRSALRAIAKPFLGPTDESISAYMISNWLGKNLTANTSLRSPIWTISIATENPEFGHELLQFIHMTADRIVRERSLLNVSERLAFLGQRLEQTSQPEFRDQLVFLILEQERLLMVLSANTPYASIVVDPVHVSDWPVWPPKVPLIGVLTIGIFGLITLLSFFRR